MVIVATPALPAPSRPVTVITFAPGCSAALGIVQFVNETGVPLAPRSLLHDNWVTPTLSFAVPARLIAAAVVVTPGAGLLIAIVGAVLSRVTVSVAVELFPARSVAVNVNTF